MHPRRADIEAALVELRTQVRGGSVVDMWRDPNSERRPTPEARAAREWHRDQYARLLDEALGRSRFEPITMPEGRCPPDFEMVLAWAMHRGGAALARYPDFASRRADTISLGAADDTLVVYEGPLRLDGLVRLSGTVVVLGDLTVDGGLIDGWASESALVVIGDEKVRALQAETDHLVTGDLDADLLLVASEATTLSIGGQLTTRLTLAQYWKPDPGAGLTVSDFDEATLAEAVRGWLSPGPAAGPLDVDELFSRVARGDWKVQQARDTDGGATIESVGGEHPSAG